MVSPEWHESDQVDAARVFQKARAALKRKYFLSGSVFSILFCVAGIFFLPWLQNRQEPVFRKKAIAPDQEKSCEILLRQTSDNREIYYPEITCSFASHLVLLVREQDSTRELILKVENNIPVSPDIYVHSTADFSISYSEAVISRLPADKIQAGIL